MLHLIALIGAFSLVTSVSNHYTLSLSDTSVGVQADRDSIVRMHFPTNHPESSRDGMGAKYRDVFPGIDLTVYRNRDDFEYDWIVMPGADAAAIDLTFTGMQYERIESNGDLILGTAEGQVRHGRPFAYQEVDGVKRQIPAAFRLASDGHVRFRLGGYDKTRTLIIDPVLSFASGIGGSGLINYRGRVNPERIRVP